MASLPKLPDILSGRAATQMPVPTGYRILCAVPQVEEKTEGGIIKTEQTLFEEEMLTTVLFVVTMGPDCYKDPKRFPTGPWCKEGDFILVRPHAGTKVRVFNTTLRIINDDSVEAVVEDPRGYKRG